ncbi:MAG: threonine/serine dehydratase [Phenylobacterium sp.]|uniref:threonine ammonia-lyase n=1 Tax=Phenylobacterium sp. TaxID=1871053 RepID=UPI001B72C84B|nr:threonine/serine dehydratase [Phenylobacterium sp.]MBP7648570.1 threonine/serine dehydratase [Phenylobacterium sp.]MBP7815806.1 threonine/serine dehydratase [Phenylobacterium sp.]MBP9230780.1 threonine/serine dehydratase [Phenylobacterium sp.]MBP9754019.1 threonine/serine dehydratase [Phenylobacterium sp.]
MSVTLADIQAAATRIRGHAVETPLIESPALNDRLGRRVLIKPETLQRVGAFKFRGAYNRLVQLDAAQRKAGVVAFSSGNHAQGVALAAKLLGIPALIVMPGDAPSVKVEATRGYGAEVRLYDRLTEDRVAIAAEIAAQRGAIVVPAFDDLDIIAGQGTVGLELVTQARALGVNFDVVVAPVGGGGLMAGVSTAVKALSPSTALVGVEPEGFDDTLRSLRVGSRQTLKPATRSLCDALESPAPGELTFPILQRTVADIAVVSDAEVVDAMRYAFSTLKLVVEPGGAVGLAALLAGKVGAWGAGTTGLVLSGGNVDPALVTKVLRGS